MKKELTGFYVAEIKRKYKDREYVAYLLRRSYRQGGKVKQQTLGNLSHLPLETIEVIRRSLRGQTFVPVDEGIEIVRSQAHGHVSAIRAMLRKLELHEIIDPRPSRMRDLVEAMIVSRIAAPRTKLATVRSWHTTTLPEDLGIEDATEDDLYEAMDWLLKRQERIETKLAKRHLHNGTLVLYDVSSGYVEGTKCPLAAFGYNCDGKKGKRRIVYGLMIDASGRPLGIEVYAGNTVDSGTVTDRVKQLKDRFGLAHVVLTGDRGMLTQARIDELKKIGGIDWISALRAPDIRKLAEKDLIQPSLFDEHDLVEICSPDFPGERLIVCRNPFLQEDRARTREELLKATEKDLDQIERRVAAGRLLRKEKIGMAVGRVLNKYKVGKHFQIDIDEGRFSYCRKHAAIEREAALDGIYVIRTSVPAEKMTSEEAVLSYKSLSRAERAFRTLKSVDPKIRPIHHWTEERVRSHIFLCMLAYYVEWHLREAWKPMLFDDEYPGTHEDDSVVRPAVRSERTRKKAQSKTRGNGRVVHSFQTLLAELATITRNTVRIPAMPESEPFYVMTTPTPLQKEALDRVGASVKSSPRKKSP